MPRAPGSPLEVSLQVEQTGFRIDLIPQDERCAIAGAARKTLYEDNWEKVFW